MPAWLLPAITAGLQTGTSLFNMGQQAKANRESRDFTMQMYQRQRDDALKDWQMMTDYNSPVSQMARYRDAGLNPNLIYGQAQGSSAPPVRSSSAGDYNPRPPQFDSGGISNSLMSYYDVQIKEAQVDNLKAQNTVIAQDALLKAAQTEATTSGAARTQFDLGVKTELRDTSIELSKEALRRAQIGNQFTLDENERRAVTTASSLQKAAEEVLSIRLQRAKTYEEINAIKGQMQSVKRDVTLKDLDIKLKRLGIQPGDAMWTRVLGQYLQGAGSNIPALKGNFDTTFPGGKAAFDSLFAPKGGDPYRK